MIKIKWLIFLVTLIPSIGYSTTFECRAIDPKDSPLIYKLDIDSTKREAFINPEVDLGDDKKLIFIEETTSSLHYRNRSDDFKFVTFVSLNKKSGLLKITRTISIPDQIKSNETFEFKKEVLTTKRTSFKDLIYQCS